GRIVRDDLRRHGAPDELTDPLDDVAGLAVLLRKERWIGRGAGENAPLGDLLDFGDAPGVDENPHVVLRSWFAAPLRLRPAAVGLWSASSRRIDALRLGLAYPVGSGRVDALCVPAQLVPQDTRHVGDVGGGAERGRGEQSEPRAAQQNVT